MVRFEDDEKDNEGSGRKDEKVEGVGGKNDKNKAEKNEGQKENIQEIIKSGVEGEKLRKENRDELEKLEEIARTHLENYKKTLEKLRKEKPLKVIVERLDRYAVDEKIERSVLPEFVSAIAFHAFPVELKPHILLEGPPGTGKSYLADEIGRISGARVLKVDVATVTKASEISEVFEMARIFRRISLMVQMKEENKKIDEIIKNVAEKLKVREDVIKSYIKNEEDFLDIVQPIDIAKTTLITNLKEKIKEEANSDIITENYIISLFNRQLHGVPVLIILDEIDAAGDRTLMPNPVLNQLLKEIDASSLPSFMNGITCIGITNRPLFIDQALTRSGRLKILNFPYPSKKTREKIARTIMRRFYDPSLSFGNKEDEEKIIDIVSSVPFTTGADIKEFFEHLIRMKKVDANLDEEIVIKPNEVLELLKKAQTDNKKIGKFVRVESRLGLLEKIEGKIKEKPKLVQMSEVFEETLKERAEPLIETILDRVIEKKEKKKEEAVDEATVEEGFVTLYNVLTRALPTTIGLSHLLHYLNDCMKKGKGCVVGFDSDDIASLVKEGLRHYALENAEKDKDHHLPITVDAAEILEGIVGVTTKNLEEVLSYIKQQENLIMHIKNAPVLFGTGQFNLEHTPKFIEILKTAKENGSIVLYAAPLYNVFSLIDVIDNSDFRLDLFTSDSTKAVLGEKEVIEVIRKKSFSTKELKRLYDEILSSLISVLKYDNLKDPTEFGTSYVKTVSALNDSYALDKYSKDHKDLKRLVLNVMEFVMGIDIKIQKELREKFKDLLVKKKLKGQRKLENKKEENVN